MLRLTIPGVALLGAFVVALIGVLTFERPPVDVIATGPQGTGMQVLYNPAHLTAQLAANQAPPALPQIDAGPKASTVYKNVQVLGNISTGAFTRLMVSMANWVAPTQGCNYCHVAGNFASDAKYTKVVARRMLQMTIAINTNYQSHVSNVGVTCYTCHRGQNNPSQVWFTGVTPGSGPGLAEVNMGAGLPTASADGSSLPSDPFTPFLLNNDPIRVNANTALPSGDRSSLKQTEWTYALMMSYSTALGVGCEFCHNSRAIQAWDESTPQRVTAWYAEGMLRDLNRNYMVPLTGVFPAALRGPSGDVAKINCATCHQGVYKPLFGAQMAANFPALEGNGTSAPAAAPASVNSGPGPAAPSPPPPGPGSTKP
jgi:photosynthetic reaction center cytochrome c subunit